METRNPSHQGEWLSGSGPESDIVISSRVRLARNIKGYPFVPRLKPKVREELETLVSTALVKTPTPAGHVDYMPLAGAMELDLEYLVERHLISRDLAAAQGARGVAVGENEILSVMVGEEDHLRLQCLMSGFQLDRIWTLLDSVDSHIDSALPYAFHPQFGYLTSCPTNVGTGMRASVMLHLPGLALTSQLDKVFYAVSKISLAVRGLYGEGSQAASDLYQISNQVTLGKTEAEILANLKSVIPQIIAYERGARTKLLSDQRLKIEDRVFRAQGIMSSARQLTMEECLDHLSTLRLGVNLGLLKDLTIAKLNRLFILSLPGHLQKSRGTVLDAEAQNEARAKLVRETLS
ncbi:MAG: protein arginine kinase [Planctomycetota bacterium]